MPIGLSVHNNKLKSGMYNHAGLSVYRPMEQQLERLFNMPRVKVSPDFIHYRNGYSVMYAKTPYASNPGSFPQRDEELQRMYALSEAGQLTRDMLKGPNWIHVVSPLDEEEASCVMIRENNGVVTGCADVWQEGITENEVVCIGGKTYLKCHVDCMERIYRRRNQSTPGFCPEEAR